MDLTALVQSCAVGVPHDRMHAIVAVESSQNPFAIGVVGGRLQRQPQNLAEAIATAEMLERQNWNFSLGVAQVNRYNLAKYGLTFQKAFDPCRNLQAATKILLDCFDRAKTQMVDVSKAWEMAYSCYYAGDFVRGFKLGYVARVVNAHGQLRLSSTAQKDAAPVVGQRVVELRNNGSVAQDASFKQPAGVAQASAVANEQKDLLMVSVDAKGAGGSDRSDDAPGGVRHLQPIVLERLSGDVKSQDGVNQNASPKNGQLKQNEWRNRPSGDLNDVLVF